MSVTNASFDWRLIRSFLAALDAGSLLGAARVLRTTQPTVGRHIAELEAQLGTVLFERTGRGLKPSPSALGMVESARAMEQAALGLSKALLGTQNAISGTVRITTSAPVACGLLPSILARMRIALPDIQIELVASTAVSNLLRREADIAVRMVRPEQGSLVAKRLGNVAIGPWAHAHYLTRRGAPLDTEDLLKHDLIGGDSDETILRGFAAMGSPQTPAVFALRTDDLMAQWAAVNGGFGIGFVADYMCHGRPDLQRVLPQLQLPPLPMWLAVHREIHTNKRIRAVYDFLAAQLPLALSSDAREQ